MITGEYIRGIYTPHVITFGMLLHINGEFRIETISFLVAVRLITRPSLSISMLKSIYKAVPAVCVIPFINIINKLEYEVEIVWSHLLLLICFKKTLRKLCLMLVLDYHLSLVHILGMFSMLALLINCEISLLVHLLSCILVFVFIYIYSFEKSCVEICRLLQLSKI
jgi:hypothetical protein